MKRNRVAKWLAAALVAVLGVAGPACDCSGKEHGDATVVTYWAAAAMEETVAIAKAIKWYNENNTDNIYISYQNKPSGGFAELLTRTLTAGVKGPDLFPIGTGSVKAMASFGGTGVLQDLTPYVDADPDGLSEILPSMLSPYRYHNKKMSLNADDPLYGLPLNVNSAVMSYNATAMLNHGIKIISVDEADIDAFNAGAPDNYGKTNADYGITWDVRPRGFDRENNFVPYVYDASGNRFPSGNMWEQSVKDGWIEPAYKDNKVDERMVFNNRIAMNWDEVEDLGRIMTQSYCTGNASDRPSTQFGYFTRYWSNYGWGVGGAAAKDRTGNGDWEFTLGDKTQYCLLYEMAGEQPDYSVDTPVVNGNDGRPVFVPAAETAAYKKTANQYFTPVMPSMYRAFERFFHLQKPQAYGGLQIGPRQSTELGSTTELAFFSTGKMAMFNHFESQFILSARKAIGNSFEWDIAPVPVYKVYDTDGSVLNQSISTSFIYASEGVCMWNNSPRKEAAYKVMKYLASGEYQGYLRDLGLRLSGASKYNHENFAKSNSESGLPPQNIRLFADSLPMRFTDEAEFFPDAYWVTCWAQPLNSTYRENNLPLNDFFDKYTATANAELIKTKQSLQ